MFMNIENAYDRVGRLEIWELLRMCGAGGKILSAIKSMYAVHIVHVRICRKLDESS
jgi:hypothetical protein